MKVLIIYFSQTGNTIKIAESIRDGIAATGSTCELLGLKETDPESLADYDIVGLGAPVFWYKEPSNVRDFILTLPQLQGQHWFAFCTHGNIIGNYFPSVSKKLGDKGATVIGYHNTYANITVPFYPDPSYTSGHPDVLDFVAARDFGQNLVGLSPKIAAGADELLPTPGPVSSAPWIEEGKALTDEVIKKLIPKFSINPEKCIQCHTCEENCPVDGIDIAAKPPRIQKPCMYCWRCVTICPTLAVEADWDALVAMAPGNYARYKEELDKVAARGGFRWLVDPDSIDVNDPLYRQRRRATEQK